MNSREEDADNAHIPTEGVTSCPLLPNSDSTGSLSKNSPNGSTSSASSFLPPIFGERDSSRSGSDSCESRSDFPNHDNRTTTSSGWISRNSVTQSGQQSHSNTPPNKSPTKLPRLDGYDNGNRSVSNSSNNSILNSSLILGASSNGRSWEDIVGCHDLYLNSDQAGTVNGAPNVMDPLTHLLFRNQNASVADKAPDSVKLPKIEARGGTSPRDLVPSDDSMPDARNEQGFATHLDVKQHHGTTTTVYSVKRKHRKKRQSESQMNVDQSNAVDQSYCSNEDHIAKGLCDRDSQCYVAGAEKLAQSSGFHVGYEAPFDGTMDADEPARARVEFSLPDSGMHYEPDGIVADNRERNAYIHIQIPTESFEDTTPHAIAG